MTTAAAPPAPPLPADVLVEAVLLGTLLRDPAVLADLPTPLAGADFYSVAHQWVYAACCDQAAQRAPGDVVSVAHALERAGHLAELGGVEYLAGLQQAAPVEAPVAHYAALVSAAAGLRRLIAVGKQIVQIGHSTSDPDTAYSEAERALFAVTQQQAPTGATLGSAMHAYMVDLEERIAGVTAPVGWLLGLPTLDRLTGGCRRGKLWIVGGLSSGGKSTVIEDWALTLQRAGARVGFCSYEMEEPELAERGLANLARVDSTLLRDGVLSEAELRRVREAYYAREALDASNPIPLVTGAQTLAALASWARRQKAQRGLDVLIVDYLGLLDLPGKDERKELDDAMRQLKLLASDLSITIIIPSQLANEALEKPARTWLRYLRGSGGIRQHADVVIILGTDPETRPADGTDPWPVQMHLTKQRGGPVGDFPVLLWPAYSRVGEQAARDGRDA